MPSLMVYVNNKVYDYLSREAQKENVTPAKKASMFLELLAEEENLLNELEGKE